MKSLKMTAVFALLIVGMTPNAARSDDFEVSYNSTQDCDATIHRLKKNPNIYFCFWTLKKDFLSKVLAALIVGDDREFDRCCPPNKQGQQEVFVVGSKDARSTFKLNFQILNKSHNDETDNAHHAIMSINAN